MIAEDGSERGFEDGPETRRSEEHLLVVDDEQVARDSLAAWFREDGYTVDTAATGAEGLVLCRQREYAVCFLDLRMPTGPDGIETMREIRQILPDASIVIMTAFASVDTAVHAMKEGAEDYLVKPFSLKEASLLVERLFRHRQLRREVHYLRRRLHGRYRFQDLLSKSPRMHEIFDLIRSVANLRTTVLIDGESGVGKELVARAIHYSRDRASHPFVAVCCTALTETLLESELFGHEKGAFTGAVARRAGKFELASGGSLFLDEIGEIPAKVQVELLRILEQRAFYRVGGVEEIKVDVRVIAATHQDLAASVAAGTFREDLYYRLNVVRVCIPPLRDRLEDVPILATHFAAELASEHARPVPRVSEAALQLLLAHRWPGNVRELRNAIERAMVSNREELLTGHDFEFLRVREQAGQVWAPPTHLTLAEIERQVISTVLRRLGGNVRETAHLLGIDRSTLYDKLRRYGIER